MGQARSRPTQSGVRACGRPHGRIYKKVWSNAAGTGSSAIYNQFINDGWNLLAERDGNTTARDAENRLSSAQNTDCLHLVATTVQILEPYVIPGLLILPPAKAKAHCQTIALGNTVAIEIWQ